MSLPDNFLHAMEFVFRSEGGTNNDPIDRGGKTNFGISQKQYPHIDIDSLTRNQALEIYLQDYWMQNKCHLIQNPIAIALFDSNINCGTIARVWLQKAINGDNANFLVVDGIIGSKTLLACHAMPQYRIAGRLIGYRVQYYADLIKRLPEQVKYIRGWNKRAGYLLQYI